MTEPADPIVLVDTHHQARKVRWAFWFGVLWVIGWFYWANDLAHSYGLSPGDGGVLRPVEQRLTAAGILVLIGILPFIGMVIYVRRYVVRLTRLGDMVTLTGIGWPVPARSWPTAAFAQGREYDGRLNTVIHNVDAPWLTLKIDGRSYIVDLQAEHVDRPELARLLRDAKGARR